MKSPKLIGDLSPGAGVGMKQAQALDRVDAPFLTSSGPGFITRKKNGYTEVQPLGKKVEQAEPYLWALGTPEFSISLPDVFYSNDVFLSDPGKKKFKRVANAGLMTSFAAGVYLGGKIGLVECSSTTGYPEDFQYRLASVSPKSGAAFAVGDAVAMTPRSLFVTGKNDAGEVQWGMAARPVSYAYTQTAADAGFSGNYIDEPIFGASYPCAPHIVRHNGDVVALPAEPEPYRVYFGGSVHEAGRGKLLSLVIPRDSIYQPVIGSGLPAELKQTAPYIAMSEDHGATWSRVDATALSSLIRTRDVYAEPSSTVYATQDSNVMRRLGLTARFVYLGNNVSLLIANELKTTGGVTFSAIFQFNATVGTLIRVDSGFTDTRGVWRTSMASLYSSGASALPQFDPPVFLYPTTMCFGRGCCAIPITVGFDYALRVTYDFGSTWQTIVLPVEVGQGAFFAMAPYVDAEHPGRLVMQNGSDLYTTTGLFSTFKPLGPTSRPTHATGMPVWFRKRGALFPELPSEY